MNADRQTASQLSNACKQSYRLQLSFQVMNIKAVRQKKVRNNSIATIEKMMSVQHFAKRLPCFSPISTSPSRETPTRSIVIHLNIAGRNVYSNRY